MPLRPFALLLTDGRESIAVGVAQDSLEAFFDKAYRDAPRSPAADAALMRFLACAAMPFCPEPALAGGQGAGEPCAFKAKTDCLLARASEAARILNGLLGCVCCPTEKASALQEDKLLALAFGKAQSKAPIFFKKAARNDKA